jgi:A/G-specific adenine glycosylase
LVKKSRLRQKLLKWYDANLRDLPWRDSHDAYAIWVSEVMLQQTQVQTVIPFFRNFLKSFPTIQALADANSQELLHAWAGLGYYSRVRCLQKAAQEIVKKHGGRFPETYCDLLALPGIGRYTAGAILSIAFNKPHSVVDGNVTRVVSRLFLLTEDSRTSKFKKILWNLAGQLLSRNSPGNFNQALMELGATICSPRSPTCLLCPWNTECLARREGLEEQLPRKTGRSESVESQQAVAVVGHRGRYLIVKRKGARVLRDFWEFPGCEFKQAEDLKRSLASRIRRDLGLKICLKDRLVTVKHVITKHRITVQAFLAELSPSQPTLKKNRNIRWVRLSEVDRYPFGSASMRILRVLRDRKASGTM